MASCGKARVSESGDPPQGAHASLEPDPSVDTVRAHAPGTCWVWGVCSKLLTPAHQCLLGAHSGGTPLLPVGRPGPNLSQQARGRWECRPRACVHAEAEGTRPELASQARKSGSCPLSSWAWSLDQHLGPGQALSPEPSSFASPGGGGGSGRGITSLLEVELGSFSVSWGGGDSVGFCTPHPQVQSKPHGLGVACGS